MLRNLVTDLIVEAKLQKGFSWAELASAIGKPETWTVAALLGEHPLSSDDASTILAMLDLDPGLALTLARVPLRGSGSQMSSSDPTIYRFHEALMVYGPALKELIHEKFGDGIMSAINFSIEVDRAPHPEGDRVVVKMSGKFLAYEWKA